MFRISTSILNPLWFVCLFTFLFFLYLFRFAEHYSKIDGTTVIYIFTSIVFYFLGLGFAKSIKLKARIKKSKITVNLTVVWSLYFLSVGFFVLEYIFFFNTYQTIPILSENVEILRFAFPINGYIHMIAMMNYVLLYIICVYYYHSKTNISNQIQLLIFLTITLSLLLGIGLGNRGVILIFLLNLGLGIKAKTSINLFKTVLIFIVILYSLGLVKYWRDRSHYGESITKTIEKDWYFSNSQISYPLYYSYLTATSSFNILNQYIVNLHEYQWGYFTLIKPIADLYPGKQYGFVDLQKKVLNKEFHGVLTSTILGAPYVDWSFGGGPFIMFFLGYYLKRKHMSILQSWHTKDIIQYGYIYVYVILGCYAYVFNTFHMLLYISIVYLLSNFFRYEPIIAEEKKRY